MQRHLLSRWHEEYLCSKPSFGPAFTTIHRGWPDLRHSPPARISLASLVPAVTETGVRLPMFGCLTPLHDQSHSQSQACGWSRSWSSSPRLLAQLSSHVAQPSLRGMVLIGSRGLVSSPLPSALNVGVFGLQPSGTPPKWRGEPDEGHCRRYVSRVSRPIHRQSTIRRQCLKAVVVVQLCTQAKRDATRGRKGFSRRRLASCLSRGTKSKGALLPAEVDSTGLRCCVPVLQR
jgi:hypothetical protein